MLLKLLHEVMLVHHVRDYSSSSLKPGGERTDAYLAAGTSTFIPWKSIYL